MLSPIKIGKMLLTTGISQFNLPSFEFIEKRLIKGGVIVFDDYGIYGVDSVKKFISKISKTRKNKFTFVYNFMGQCILIKK